MPAETTKHASSVTRPLTLGDPARGVGKKSRDHGNTGFYNLWQRKQLAPLMCRESCDSSNTKILAFQLAICSISLLKQINNLSVSKFMLTPSVPLSLSLSLIERGINTVPINKALLHHPLFHPASTVGSEQCITKRLSWKA